MMYMYMYMYFNPPFQILKARHPVCISIFINEKFFELKGIVEKVQETSSNTGIHDTTVCICHYYTA